MVPVTVIEIPAMKVAAIRAYTKDTPESILSPKYGSAPDPALNRRISLHKTYDGSAAQKAILDGIKAGTVVEIFALVHTTGNWYRGSQEGS